MIFSCNNYNLCQEFTQDCDILHEQPTIGHHPFRQANSPHLVELFIYFLLYFTQKEYLRAIILKIGQIMKPTVAITVPYAVANFVEMRERGFYYVDKTDFIPQLELYKAPVFLRPRRFGKSLYCSMLAAYYDVNTADRFDELFGDTYIGKNPTPEHNKYIVIRFDFSKMVMADTMEGLERNFNNLNCNVLEGVVKGTARYPHLFPDFTFRNDQDASTMLEDILVYVTQNHLPPVYIIIDEYDNFTNQLLTAYNDPLYENVTTADSFLRTFFKIIKAGIGEGSVRTCFCTGVLPVTMDDLTSGYNIAEILTLKPAFLNMLGFTHAEAATYLRYVLRKYAGSDEQFDEYWKLIVSNYDGYRFQPKAEPLFNSTILTYFLKNFAETGIVPDEMIDENLRTDINWIRRLALSQENAQRMLDTLVMEDGMDYAQPELRSKFNKQKFFDKNFYPISLFYLGMTTLKDAYTMVLPNLTMRSIYIDYYNQLNNIDNFATRYVPAFRAYVQDRDLAGVFRNYYEQYLGQFPAQVFDKMNENFIRCSFFELCSRYLSQCYTFALEQNNPAGRSDFEMTGIPGTEYYKDHRIVEFKYFKAGDAKKVLALTEPRPEDVEQVKQYAETIRTQFPYYHIKTYVAYVAANKGYRFFEV